MKKASFLFNALIMGSQLLWLPWACLDRLYIAHSWYWMTLFWSKWCKGLFQFPAPQSLSIIAHTGKRWYAYEHWNKDQRPFALIKSIDNVNGVSTLTFLLKWLVFCPATPRCVLLLSKCRSGRRHSTWSRTAVMHWSEGTIRRHSWPRTAQNTLPNSSTYCFLLIRT